MDLKSFGEAIAKLGLPLLGAALPIPGGEAIGAALASHIGAPSSSPEDILATLTQSADAIQKAKEFELTHQETMLKITTDYEIEQQKVDAGDRASAREREMSIKDSTPARLAYMIIGGFFGIAIAQLVALMGWPDEAAKIPPQGWVIIGNISGYLAAEAKAAAAYYFGTTMDSGRKTDLLAEAGK